MLEGCSRTLWGWFNDSQRDTKAHEEGSMSHLSGAQMEDAVVMGPCRGSLVKIIYARRSKVRALSFSRIADSFQFEMASTRAPAFAKCLDVERFLSANSLINMSITNSLHSLKTKSNPTQLGCLTPNLGCHVPCWPHVACFFQAACASLHLNAGA